jgi:hypothetical protein
MGRSHRNNVYYKATRNYSITGQTSSFKGETATLVHVAARVKSQYAQAVTHSLFNPHPLTAIKQARLPSYHMTTSHIRSPIKIERMGILEEYTS